MQNGSEGKQSWGDPAPHLSAEQIVELVARGRRSRRYGELIDHITECPLCRETYKQLLQAEQAMHATRQSLWVPTWRFWLPAAAAMVVLIWGIWVLQGAGAKATGIRQVGSNWYENGIRLPEWASSAAVQFAAPPVATLRSDDHFAQRPIVLLTPDPMNAALESSTPEFRWKAIPDAIRYRARIERTDGSQKVVLEVQGTRAVLPQNLNLSPGYEYRLTLEALAPNELPGEGLTSVYEFRVLTNEEQTHLRWARANRRNAPRTCVVIFYQLGFYAEALETLSLLPNDSLTQQWRETIQARLNAQ
ncbi:MAG: hypothetical protein KatS3mg016_1994 [Fimbriimonadales bacterium]|nr:MAG: hypothetical protein KatS3mg016_1994 [Fimbriimonadales bacterium]